MLMKQVHLLREHIILDERVEAKKTSSNLLLTTENSVSHGPEASDQVNANSPPLATNPVQRQNDTTEPAHVICSSVNLPNSLDGQFKQLRAILRDTTPQNARTAASAKSPALGNEIALTITPALRKHLQTRKETHLSDANVSRYFKIEDKETNPSTGTTPPRSRRRSKQESSNPEIRRHHRSPSLKRNRSLHSCLRRAGTTPPPRDHE